MITLKKMNFHPPQQFFFEYIAATTENIVMDLGGGFIIFKTAWMIEICMGLIFANQFSLKNILRDVHH